MRHTALSLGLVGLGALLVGCADRQALAPDPTSSPLASAGGGPGHPTQAVKGSGHFTEAGGQRTFAFNAERYGDGSVRGEIQLISRRLDRVVHGTVTCVTVFGSAAWLGGIIDRDNSGVTTGREFGFRVVDLAQSPGGSPDLLSLVNAPPTPGYAQGYCDTAPFFPPLIATESGEITVTQPGSTSFTSSLVIPINIAVFVPCAVGGAGELVQLSGELHSLFHFTDDGAGGYHVMQENNPQGVSGTGLSSDDKYQGTGVTRYDFNAGSLPFNTTYVNNFRIIGQGSGNNLLIHATFHVTVNATGEVTAVVDKFSAECH